MTLFLHQDDPIGVGQLFHLEPDDYERPPQDSTGGWAVVVVAPVEVVVARLLPISSTNPAGLLIPERAMWGLPDGGWVLGDSVTIDPRKLYERAYGGVLSPAWKDAVWQFHRDNVELEGEEERLRRLMRFDDRRNWPGKAPTL